MAKKDLYEIKLEDYRFPRYAAVLRSYYGTMDDIINLMVHLADDDWTCNRYRETIDAAETYIMDPDITHTVVGQKLPILTPVEEVCRFETSLSNQNWQYTGYNGVVYSCRAEHLDICQILIRTDSGYDRCLKATISGLLICYPSIGLVAQSFVIKGFPGAITWDGEHHTMNLFVPLDHYPFDKQDQAFADVVDINAIDLSAIMGDILAEG